MSEPIKGATYAEKLQTLLNRNKRIVADLELGILTTQQASESVNQITREMKELALQRQK